MSFAYEEGEAEVVAGETVDKSLGVMFMFVGYSEQAGSGYHMKEMSVNW